MPVDDQIGFKGEEWRATSGEHRNVFLEELYSLPSAKLHPEYYHISKVSWKIFGTLTWRTAARRRPNAQARREQDFMTLLVLTAKALKVSARQIHRYFYHAMEFGAAGECHFHFVIAQAGLESISADVLARCMQRIWTREYKLDVTSVRAGAGTAQIVPFDQARHLKGCAYLCKREFDEKWQQRDRFDRMSEDLPRLFAPASTEQRTRPPKERGLLALTTFQQGDTL